MNNGQEKIYHSVRVKVYDTGGWEMMAASREVFVEYPNGKPKKTEKRKKCAIVGPAVEPCDADAIAKDNNNPVDTERAMRRARARVRDIALSNRFRWFVTLTLDKSKVDRYDMKQILRVLNRWLDNRVRRHGLAYVLVPERHQDGAIHFHGLFNDAVEARPSGHTDSSGHEIYNLPEWPLGFTAAIEIYGDYPRAVSYVCKYIGKQGDKPAGRWYYSGGQLAGPKLIYPDHIDMTKFNLAHPEAYFFQVPETGLYISILRGDEHESMDEEFA